jgi:large subunit ribosomal protein L15
VADDLNLSNLKPAQARTARKRIGRGLGSGKGRYSGRGIKGQKSRSGSNKMRAGFEGGQMPLHMRVGKQRGATSKDAMPIGPFRTTTVPVNVRDLERVFADGDTVNVEALVEKGLIKNTRADVKVLGNGELTKKLSVTAHGFSATAREKIGAAGGTATALKQPADPRAAKKRRKRKKEMPETAAAATEAGAKGAAQEPDESVDVEPEGSAEVPEGEG